MCSRCATAERRETAWERLDTVPVGQTFTLKSLWRSKWGYGPAGYSATYFTITEAVRLGYVEIVGHVHRQGRPNLYRRIK